MKSTVAFINLPVIKRQRLFETWNNAHFQCVASLSYYVPENRHNITLKNTEYGLTSQSFFASPDSAFGNSQGLFPGQAPFTSCQLLVKA